MIMNRIERQMLDLLRVGREEFGAHSVRAEFEAEGARREELLRLLEIGYKADLGLIIKIGGCEAIRDLQEAKVLGADRIVAPMVETPYALQKFIHAIQRCYSLEERQQTKFYFNIETFQAFKTKEELIALSQSGGLSGIVFGRVDFVGSLGLSRDFLNKPEITDKICQTAEICRTYQQDFILGGGIDPASTSVIQQVQQIHLTCFETRKIAFFPHQIEQQKISKALGLAAEFELLWLKNKQNYYSMLQQEDADRILLLEKRVQYLTAA
jgi:citrate lyase beta subunit